MPILASLGAGAIGAYRMFRGGGAPVVNYIEDVFSTYLYTSTGADITVTNGIDLSTKGGLVWIKSRSNAYSHYLTDTARGVGRVLYSELVNGQSAPGGGGASAFNTNGYVDGNQNPNGTTQVSWTFRKQAKFFDVVTYTGNGVAGRTVSHSLGSVPGCIICKRTDSTSGWAIWHRGNGSTSYGLFALNSTAAATANFSAAPTSTTFEAYNIWDTGNPANAAGATYVAYLFAHDAGGFGAAGSDNVISCGSYAGNGSASGVSVNLGYEPQWVLRKRVDSADSGNANWLITDIMRGITIDSTDRNLYTNLTNSEAGSQNIDVNATGFTAFDTGIGGYNQSGATYIYIAIRRGPMKTPTSGTDVFSPITLAVNGSTNQTLVNTGWPIDWQVGPVQANGGDQKFVHTRLTGNSKRLYASATNAEEASSVDFGWSTGMKQSQTNAAATWYLWRRAPGFFDIVCYDGLGSGSDTANITHNLGVAPEMVIYKSRNNVSQWVVRGTFGFLILNSDQSALSPTPLPATTTTFQASASGNAQLSQYQSGYTYVAYLFATCPGISKVGSYTGTGTTLQVNCGFTSGARFVLIKRTDSTGDWYVWDTARGIIAGNDPFLILNSIGADTTSTDFIDPYSPGFEISSTAPVGINASGGTYIFLAIA